MKKNNRGDAFNLYNKIKPHYQDAILLIRCKDQYICFNDEAELVKQYAGMPGKKQIRNRDCIGYSFPATQADRVISIQVKAGFRVGICDPVMNGNQV